MNTREACNSDSGNKECSFLSLIYGAIDNRTNCNASVVNKNKYHGVSG